jgi:hypothetical protein
MSMQLRRAAVVIVTAASSVGAFAGVAYAAGTHWTVEQVAVPHAPSGSLRGVSCVPATDGERCLAVGASIAGDARTTDLTVVGDGTSWQRAGSPHRPDAATTMLSAVSCVRANLCFAVGYDTARGSAGQRSVSAQWNGSSWRVVPTPDPVTGDGSTVELSDVSCASSIRCVAVGSYSTGSGRSTPLALNWNGQSWEQLELHLPSGVTGGGLTGIDCPTARVCVAVGTQTGDEDTAPVTAYVDGMTVELGSAAARDDVAVLVSVSCTSTTACTAVGHSSSDIWDRTLVETLAGSDWTIVDSPDRDEFNNDLFAISCTSAASCLAVGQHERGGRTRTLAERWDGVSWQLSAAPNSADAFYTGLYGVSCVADTDCVAGGARYVYAPPGQSFSARWHDGQWSVLTGGSAAGLKPSTFAAVSCPSTTSCVAVGTQFTVDVHDQTFAEQRTGADWSLQGLPAVSGFTNSALTAVSCSGVGECIAVGWADNRRSGGDRFERALAVRLHDGTWTLSPTAEAPRGDNLAGVSCPTSTFCAAVGFGVDGPAGLIYDGTSWHDSPLPDTCYGCDGLMTGVSCTAADQCIAVGYLYPDPFSTRTTPVAYHWDGATWSRASDGMTGQEVSVSCTSPSFCMAVGTTAQSWDGTSWTQRALAYTNSVSCVSPRNCVAVGTRASGTPREVIEQWTGTRWLLRTDVEPSSPYASLHGASCASATMCVAVGEAPRIASLVITGEGYETPAPLVESTSG